MDNNSLVSVCIPVYNREEFIKDAIQSVLSQTYQNFEIIIVDDGSTDKSLEKIHEINDHRIRIFKNGTNKGIAYSRNKGLKESSGEFIAILDSDDTWMPDKLQKQLRFLKYNPEFGICGTWVKQQRSNGNETVSPKVKTDEEIRLRMLWGCPIVQSSMVLRASVLRKHDIWYDPDHEYSEDYELIRRLLKHTKAHNLEECLVIYNLHDNQVTSLINHVQIENAKKTIVNYLHDLDIDVDSTQKKAFLKIRYHNFFLELNELKELKTIFLQFLKIPSKIYVNSLEVTLSEKFFLACYHSTRHGLSTARILHSIHSNLQYNPTRYEKAKFYIKCLLKR